MSTNSESVYRAVLRGGAALSVFVAVAVCGSMAHAQEAAPAAADSEAADDVIVVTGSRIVRPDLVSSSPVAVISNNDLRMNNVSSPEDILRQSPQFQASYTPSSNNGNPGVATVNLRGLGDQRTLVLVDGKRMVAYDSNGVVDLNTIPTPLIKRVEVLTGGASAVYGSDAIAGVVNFVLDDEFTGLQADASTQLTTRGDASEQNISLTGGLALGDRGHVVVSAGYTKRHPLSTSARGFSSEVIDSETGESGGGSATGVPTILDGSVGLGGADLYQLAPGGGGFVPYYGLYNYNLTNLLQVPQQRWNVTALAKYEVTDGIELFARGTYVRSKVRTQIAPSGSFFYDTYMFPDNPYLTPGLASLIFSNPANANDDGSYTIYPGRRFVENGNRISAYDNEAYQIVGGARGDLASGLHWEVFGQYARTTRKDKFLNDVSYSRYLQATDVVAGPGGPVCRDASNGCQPLNLFDPAGLSSAALDFVRQDGAQKDKSSQFIVGATLSGDLGFVKLPWADKPAAFAVGAEYRKEKASTIVDAAYGSGDLIGYGQGENVDPFSYNVKEVYAELKLPVIEDKPFIRSLNLEAGYRYSDYSTAGSVSTYKGGGDWSPVEGVRFRGLYQRAVRAPNINELTAPRTNGIGSLNFDPCAGSNPVGNAALTALCIATGVPAGQIGNLAEPSGGQVNIFLGGNRDLGVEKSDTYTLGVVLTPPQVRGLTVSIDYYNISIDNVIDYYLGSPQGVINGCYLVSQDAASPFCQAISRSGGGTFNGGLGVGIDQTQANGPSYKVSGIDVAASYPFDLGGNAGTLTAAINGTYVDKNTFKGSEFTATLNCAGRYGVSCNNPIPRWKHVATLTWSKETFSLQARWNYIGKVKQDADTEIFRSKIKAYSYFDLSGEVQMTEALQLRAGIQNLFDKKPPIVGGSAGDYAEGNTYPGVYDPYGTMLFFGITTKF